MTTTNITALVMQAIAAAQLHFAELNPNYQVPEFTTLSPEAQEETKQAFEVIIRSTGLIEKVEALQQEIELCHAKSTCCCGDYVKDHNMGSGHSPVSIYDQVLMNAEERGTLNERNRCLAIVNSEEEAEGEPTEEQLSLMLSITPVQNARAAICATKRSIANRIENSTKVQTE